MKFIVTANIDNREVEQLIVYADNQSRALYIAGDEFEEEFNLYNYKMTVKPLGA